MATIEAYHYQCDRCKAAIWTCSLTDENHIAVPQPPPGWTRYRTRAGTIVVRCTSCPPPKYHGEKVDPRPNGEPTKDWIYAEGEGGFRWSQQ